MTPPQVRAARGLLGWSRERLSDACSVPIRTIDRLEAGEGVPQRRTVAAIRCALEAAGVEFLPEDGGGVGVRLRKPSGEGS
jgi:transcriptional regulator with XRE-family HTH domain